MNLFTRQSAKRSWFCSLVLLAVMPWIALAARPEPPAAGEALRHSSAKISSVKITLGAVLADDLQGVYVASVDAESPASRARLHPGDRLLSVNGQAVSTAAELLSIVDGGKPGVRYKIQLAREGRLGQLWLVSDAKHAAGRERALCEGAAPPQLRGGAAALGVTLYDGPYIGLRVSTVQPNSPAAMAGLRAGDRVLSINGIDVAKSDDVIAFIANSLPGDAVQLRIDHKGLEASLTAVLGERDVVFGRSLAPVRYRGPADEPQRFYQTPPPGEIGD